MGQRIVIVMPDYKEMYRILFRETAKAISILQSAQQRTEEIYVEDDTIDKLIVINTDKISDDDNGKLPPQD